LDQFDRASALEEKERNDAIAAARADKEHLPPTGYCYYCGEGVRGGRRFCDAHCRDDYDEEKRLRKMGNSRA
jgi:hypothetical protein